MHSIEALHQFAQIVNDHQTVVSPQDTVEGRFRGRAVAVSIKSNVGSQTGASAYRTMDVVRFFRDNFKHQNSFQIEIKLECRSELSMDFGPRKSKFRMPRRSKQWLAEDEVVSLVESLMKDCRLHSLVNRQESRYLTGVFEVDNSCSSNVIVPMILDQMIALAASAETRPRSSAMGTASRLLKQL